MEFIKSIDPKKDCQILNSRLKFRKICLRNIRISETVLKKAAEANLTIYDIGTILFREDEDILSDIENIINHTDEVYNLFK